ncbi:hypothetical protein [Microbacterium trichothecenolyticum]|uniref:Uncharacterized protein n=1 Tax=Microbacterium trichothecenolyticum TaxID=69370 RepID=A0ABU0TXX9_MICTR|nr:hypothetical protein [Microbacterium trichothecenolyticum]MDQ1124501.1 hypothetical protein [Microbacterium trichothecenolyticum]
MSNPKAWIAILIATLAAVIALVAVAAMRFPIPLVDPAPPTPDYGLQAAIAYTGCGAVVLTGLLAGTAASRDVRRRIRRVVIGIVCIVALCVTAALAALIVPAG